MADNIFENLTDEEQNNLWMYMIFNKDKIKTKTEQWTKEAEEAGMTLTEYLEAISPLNNKKKTGHKEYDMYVCKYNTAKECKGKYKDCVYCILVQIKSEIKAEKREPDCFDDMFEYYAGINDAIYVVNRKIKELKGLDRGNKTK